MAKDSNNRAGASNLGFWVNLGGLGGGSEEAWRRLGGGSDRRLGGGLEEARRRLGGGSGKGGSGEARVRLG